MCVKADALLNEQKEQAVNSKQVLLQPVGREVLHHLTFNPQVCLIGGTCLAWRSYDITHSLLFCIIIVTLSGTLWRRECVLILSVCGRHCLLFWGLGAGWRRGRGQSRGFAWIFFFLVIGVWIVCGFVCLGFVRLRRCGNSVFFSLLFFSVIYVSFLNFGQCSDSSS